MAENVNVEFLGAQFERVFSDLRSIRDEQRSFREDMHVLTAIVLRHDSTLNGILDQPAVGGGTRAVLRAATPA